MPGCTTAAITVTAFLQVRVVNTDGTAQAGLPVYAFDGSTYTNFSQTTDGSGQAIFTLPAGNYRFRSDLNGTQFWLCRDKSETLGKEKSWKLVSIAQWVRGAGES